MGLYDFLAGKAAEGKEWVGEKYDEGKNWTNTHVTEPVKQAINYVIPNNSSGGDSGNAGNQAASLPPPRVLTEAERVVEWNTGYSDLMKDIGNCATMEARSEFVKNHQQELAEFKGSNLPVDDHLKYLCVTIDGQILPNKNGQLLTGNEAWQWSYDDLIGKIASCKSMDERSELASKHQDELVKYRDSNLPVDNDLKYLNIALGTDGKVSTIKLDNSENWLDASKKIISADTAVNTYTTAANVVADVSVQKTLNSVIGESNVIKGLNVITDVGNFGASMSAKLAAAEEVLAHGCKNVKILTGASTVTAGKEILENIKLVGKVGSVAGDIALVTAPLSELDNSMKLINKDELGRIAKYNPENYNKEVAAATAAVVGDACSAGVARSIAKTPTTLSHLIPGVPSDFGSSYDNWIDKNINVGKVYEKSVELINKAGQAVGDLPRNPHSKDLFNAYAKAELAKSLQGWTEDTNKNIAESMLKNGVRPQRVEEALKHSPEKVDNAYYFVKDVRNSPEVQQVQQSKGVGISR